MSELRSSSVRHARACAAGARWRVWVASVAADAASDDASVAAGAQTAHDAHDARWVESLLEHTPPRYLRRVPGRESFEAEFRGAHVVVKRFRGGEPRDWWSERARGVELRSPARAEAENLLALRELGLRVPEPLAWAEETAARWNAWRGRGRSVVVQRFVEHDETLEQRCVRVDARRRRALARELGACVGRLHAAGWCHRDLYLEHVLVRSDGLLLIDLGRARRHAALARRWIVKDLAALAMSCPHAIDARTRALVLARWRREQGAARARMDVQQVAARRIDAGDPGARAASARERDAQGPGARDSGAPRIDMQRLVAAIASKARRLAAHAPRYAYDRGLQRTLGWDAVRAMHDDRRAERST